ncbi:MAG: SDR family oxidoreductase, partial [Burkholderiaceae bacterium]
FIRTAMTAANPYKMPFLLDVGKFAARAADAIEAGVKYRTIPWQMGWVTALLKWMPRWLFDRVIAGRKQKPRAGVAPT